MHDEFRATALFLEEERLLRKAASSYDSAGLGPKFRKAMLEVLSQIRPLAGRDLARTKIKRVRSKQEAASKMPLTVLVKENAIPEWDKDDEDEWEQTEALVVDVLAAYPAEWVDAIDDIYVMRSDRGHAVEYLIGPDGKAVEKSASNARHRMSDDYRRAFIISIGSGIAAEPKNYRVRAGDNLNTRAVIAHELGHVMEAVVPGLARSEDMWWWDRVNPTRNPEDLDYVEVPRDGGFVPDPTERPLDTLVPRWYTMKRYKGAGGKIPLVYEERGIGNDYYEVFTTGIEGLLGETGLMYIAECLQRAQRGVSLTGRCEGEFLDYILGAIAGLPGDPLDGVLPPTPELPV